MEEGASRLMKAVWQKSSTQLVIPFAERDWIDMEHACKILGASWATVYRLFEDGEIRVIDYRVRAWKRVHYGSIVEFCDRLRAKYAIPDRKPPLSAGFLRYRDEDVLPFALSNTITAANAMAALAIGRMEALVSLFDEGKIEAYQLVEGSIWRVSKSSLLLYMEQIRHPMLAAPK